MQNKDQIKATGVVNIKLYDENGNLKQEINHHNLVVTIGKNFIASRMVTNTERPMNHMALGHGTDIPVPENTQLINESQNGRISIATPILNGNTVSFTGIFAPTYGVGNITEAGIFNSNVGGMMLCRTTFPTVEKNEQDTLAISWVVTIN